MNNKTVKKGSVFLKIINAISLTILCLYFVFQKNNILYYVFLFFGTVAFQLDLKVVLGGILMKSIKPNFDLAKKRYHISAFEFKILNFLGVKKWKDKWITVYKNQFYLDNGKNQDRIYTVFQNNIKSEIIHVVLFFLGFINVLIGYFLLKEFWWVFIIASAIFSFGIDIPPILIERFNRYRLYKIIEKKEKIK